MGVPLMNSDLEQADDRVDMCFPLRFYGKWVF